MVDLAHREPARRIARDSGVAQHDLEVLAHVPALDDGVLARAVLLLEPTGAQLLGLVRLQHDGPGARERLLELVGDRGDRDDLLLVGPEVGVDAERGGGRARGALGDQAPARRRRRPPRRLPRRRRIRASRPAPTLHGSRSRSNLHANPVVATPLAGRSGTLAGMIRRVNESRRRRRGRPELEAGRDAVRRGGAKETGPAPRDGSRTRHRRRGAGAPRSPPPRPCAGPYDSLLAIGDQPTARQSRVAQGTSCFSVVARTRDSGCVRRALPAMEWIRKRDAATFPPPRRSEAAAAT